MESQKEKRIVAVDIETSGCMVTKHGIIALGYCVGDIPRETPTKKLTFDFAESIIPTVSYTSGTSTTTRQYKKRICMKLTGKTFEQRCKEEYWDKHPEMLEELTKDALEPEVGIRQFMDDIDKLEEKYELIFISDNSAFDFAFINYYIEYYLDRRPLSYVSGGTTYRPLFDTDAYARGALGQDYTDLWTYDEEVMKKFNITLPEGVKHDHYPENDAEYIYRLHCAIILKQQTSPSFWNMINNL